MPAAVEVHRPASLRNVPQMQLTSVLLPYPFVRSDRRVRRRLLREQYQPNQ